MFLSKNPTIPTIQPDWLAKFLSHDVMQFYLKKSLITSEHIEKEAAKLSSEEKRQELLETLNDESVKQCILEGNISLTYELSDIVAQGKKKSIEIASLMLKDEVKPHVG